MSICNKVFICWLGSFVLLWCFSGYNIAIIFTSAIIYSSWKITSWTQKNDKVLLTQDSASQLPSSTVQWLTVLFSLLNFSNSPLIILNNNSLLSLWLLFSIISCPPPPSYFILPTPHPCSVNIRLGLRAYM